jgi:hypothetical protein
MEDIGIGWGWRSAVKEYLLQQLGFKVGRRPRLAQECAPRNKRYTCTLSPFPWPLLGHTAVRRTHVILGCLKACDRLN